MTAQKFAAAVEGLIIDARSRGLSDDALLIEIGDIASLLREASGTTHVSAALSQFASELDAEIKRRTWSEEYPPAQPVGRSIPN